MARKHGTRNRPAHRGAQARNAQQDGPPTRDTPAPHDRVRACQAQCGRQARMSVDQLVGDAAVTVAAAIRPALACALAHGGCDSPIDGRACKRSRSAAPIPRVRAAVLDEHGLRVREWDAPEPAPGEELLALSKVGIRGSDVHFVIDGSSQTRFRPIILGHEPAGGVRSLGPSRSWEGRRPRRRLCAVSCPAAVR